jgi:hypothetical protein
MLFMARGDALTRLQAVDHPLRTSAQAIRRVIEALIARLVALGRDHGRDAAPPHMGVP